MLEIQPRTGRHIWLKLAIREGRAREHRPPQHEVETQGGDEQINLPKLHRPGARYVDGNSEQNARRVGDRSLAGRGLGTDVRSKVGHVDAEPEKLDGLEP